MISEGFVKGMQPVLLLVLQEFIDYGNRFHEVGRKQLCDIKILLFFSFFLINYHNITKAY